MFQKIQGDMINTFMAKMCRVRMGPAGRPGKSLNFILAFSRTGKS